MGNYKVWLWKTHSSTDKGECNSIEYGSLDEYIKTVKNNGLIHIITDNNPNR